ncbi:MAG: hypothetical protein MUO26_11100, partial [Methanotrichaceae archaeon]|nr:hypothetical protein [Methanotrichaceae archaeon]
IANISEFTGRTWLLPVIRNWFEQTNDRIFILIGGPGAGKSMLAAWLTGEGPEPNEAGSKLQLEKIRSSIKASHFCIAETGMNSPRAFAEAMASQLTKKVIGFSDAMSETLKDQIQISVNVHVGEGNVTGVYIEKLNLGGLSDELSFDRILRDPIKKLYDGGFNEPIILLVDSLDEAMSYSGSIKIIELLAKLEDLPDKIRLIVTTRPDPRVLKYFPDSRKYDLIKDAPPDVNDIELYLEGRFLGLESGLRKRLVSRISRAADGNFLYTSFVVRDMLERFPNAQDWEIIYLPKGLSGIYHNFLTRELGKDEKRWYNDFKPLLGFIAVAYGEGLSRSQINRISGKDLEYSLRACKQYLEGELPEGPFRPFHRSFADFLLEDEENLDYHINAIEFHNEIINFYLGTYSNQWIDCDIYGLNYLPNHLFKAEQHQKLKDLLLDFSWIRAKLEKTNVQSLLLDYDLLSSDTELGYVQEAIQLSAHVLAQDNKQLPSQLYGRLICQESPRIQEMLKQITEFKTYPWLHPLTPSLVQAGGPLLRTLEGHTESVKGVAVIPDSRLAVSASRDNSLKVWDLENGKHLRTLRGHSYWIDAVAVTLDGKKAISASWDNTLKVWDLETGKELRTLEGHIEPVVGVAVTPEGRIVVSASRDNTLKVWDLESGKELKTLEGHTNYVNAIAVTPDGKRAVSASDDGMLKVWDLENGKELMALRGHETLVNAVALTPDGREAISASEDKSLKVWDLRTGKELRTLRDHSNWIDAVAVTPNGKQIISGSRDKSLKVWDLESGKELKTLEGHTNYVNAVAVTSNGKWAISASEDKSLKVWDLNVAEQLITLAGHGNCITGIAVTLDGKQAISVSWDDSLRVWDTESGKNLMTFKISPGSSLGVAVMPDGKRAITASWDNSLKILNLESGEELVSLAGHIDCVNGIAVTSDGRWIISASDDKTLKIWDLLKGEELRTLVGHNDSVTGVAITLDGKRIVSASRDNTLKVWDIGSCRELRTYKGHRRNVNAVAISPDCKQVVSASDDKTLKVWDLESGRELMTLEGHDGSVLGVAFTPNGKGIVSASDDKTLKVWDLESGKIIASFSGEGPIAVCSIGLNCRIIAGESAGRIHFLKLEMSRERPL